MSSFWNCQSLGRKPRLFSPLGIQINSDHEIPEIKLYSFRALKRYLNERNMIYGRVTATISEFSVIGCTFPSSLCLNGVGQFSLHHRNHSQTCFFKGNQSGDTHGHGFDAKLLLLESLQVVSAMTRNQPLRTARKARSHHPFLRIRFLLVPKIGSCEHIENDLSDMFFQRKSVR